MVIMGIQLFIQNILQRKVGSSIERMQTLNKRTLVVFCKSLLDGYATTITLDLSLVSEQNFRGFFRKASY
jgi:hypothetical protein